MGRKKRSGLDYYPTDTNKFSDRKIRRLNNKYLGIGYLVYDFICCEVYRDEGYYLKFDRDYYFDVADVLKLEEEQVRAIIEYCVEVDLFDKTQFDKGIITSRGIQHRWIDASKSAKRSNIEINPKLLVPESSTNTSESSEDVSVNTEETPITSEEKPISSEESAQKEVKESKKKKGKNIDLTFIEDDNWRQLVETWLDYKKERSQSYKGLQSIKVFYAKLLELSNSNFQTATEIVKNSIASNWSGVFALKDNKKAGEQPGQTLHPKNGQERQKQLENAGF